MPKKKTTELKAAAKATRKPKVEKIEVPIAEVPEVKVEVPKLPVCKKCGQEVRKLRWNSRSESDFSVLVCDNTDCYLYRKFQGSEGGPPPGGIRLIFV